MEVSGSLYTGIDFRGMNVDVPGFHFGCIGRTGGATSSSSESVSDSSDDVSRSESELESNSNTGLRRLIDLYRIFDIIMRM